MSAIRCVWRADPGFPATDQHPDAVRYVVGSYFVDAIGGAPTLEQVEQKLDRGGNLIAAAAVRGGVIRLPVGTWRLPAPLLQEDNLEISGSGPGTIIEGPGPGQVVIAGVRNASERQFSLRLSNLIIDGRGGYIGVDWRNVSNGRMRDVIIRNVQTGVLFSGTCYYNVLEDTGIDAVVSGIEIAGGANENTIRGGRVTSTSGPAIWITDANNTHIYGPALESVGVGVRVGAGAHATKLFGGRIEAAPVGVWLEAGATETTVVAPYMSNVVEHKRLQAPVSQYWWYGP